IELAPRATTGMAIGAEVPPPQPATIRTARMGTEVPRSVHGARPSVGRWHGIRKHRRRELGLCGFSLAQGTRRSLGETRKRFGLLGACTFGRERHGLSCPRALGTLTWSGRVEHEDKPRKCDQHQLVEKKMRHHGNALSDGSAIRAFYRVFAWSELAA